jgi:hypothetical protein
MATHLRDVTQLSWWHPAGQYRQFPARLPGFKLRALRESAGMTLRQAGEYLQRDPSMVSRFETAEYPIRRGDVLALLDLYRVSEERTHDGLLQLSDDVWRKG